jgi:hypothetical protein
MSVGLILGGFPSDLVCDLSLFREMLLVLVLNTMTVLFLVSRFLFPIWYLVTKSDLRCFVALARILLAISYVRTCRSNNQDYKDLPERDELVKFFQNLLKVYVDNFVSLVIPASREQLRHVSTGTMTGIHNVFPADKINSNNPISEKKLKQLDGEYSTK